MVVTYAAASLCNILYTAFVGAFNIVAKWEECI